MFFRNSGRASSLALLFRKQPKGGSGTMNSPPSAEKMSPWKNLVIYSGILLVVAAVYVSFVLLSRYESNRAFERRNAEELRELRREEDRRAIEQLGGSEFSIRGLYVSPAVIL